MDFPKLSIKDVGELKLVERLSRVFSGRPSSEVVHGIGDDAAVIRLNGDRLLLAACDIQVEGVHFQLSHITPYQLGRRALAVNLSDMAAMGGRPTYALVSLAMPGNLPLGVFDELIRGIDEQAREFGVEIVGGNISGARDQLTIDIFLLGEAVMGRLLTRSGAKPGDRVMVTGTLGGSAAGRMILEQYGASYPDEFRRLVESHLSPSPRVKAGILLSTSSWATAMIDISDGLAVDMLRLCRASGVGVELTREQLPLPSEITQVPLECEGFPWQAVLYGGEDYELLFTIKPDTPAETIENICEDAHCQITEVGIMLSESEGCWLRSAEGERVSLHAEGWSHFF